MQLNQAFDLEPPPLMLNARTAADMMTPNPTSLLDTATAHEAAGFLTDRGISAAPVITEAGAPVGVLSQTDLVIHAREKLDFTASSRDGAEDFGEFEQVPVAPQATWREIKFDCGEDRALARDLMTPTVFSVRLNAPAAQVIEDMLALRVHRLFVVDDDGVLVGVISALDVLRRLHPRSEDDV